MMSGGRFGISIVGADVTVMGSNPYAKRMRGLR